jgi:hypothetical protein
MYVAGQAGSHGATPSVARIGAEVNAGIVSCRHAQAYLSISTDAQSVGQLIALLVSK